MKNSVYALIIGLCFALISCKESGDKNAKTTKHYDKIEELSWLVGSWTNRTDEEESVENWTQANDSTLLAHSYTLVKGDTVFAERVSLQQFDNVVLFTVIAYRQNDDQPVTFKLIPSEKNVFTFENPEHDFPSRISYANPTKDSIHAWIEGHVNGEARKIDFYYSK